MPDSTAIAITSLIVGGVSTIAGPGVAAWLQNRREQERMRHDERVADVRELRAMLDETAHAIDELDRRLRKPTRILIVYDPPWSRDDVRKALSGVAEVRDQVERLAARLAIRLGREAPTVRAVNDALEVAERIARLVEMSSASGRWVSDSPNLQPIQEAAGRSLIAQLHDASTEAADRFLDEAQKVGAATLREDGGRRR